MIVQILGHTPTWVFVLFGALLLLGLSQTRTRDVGRARAIGLPMAMMLLSLSSVVSAFTQPVVALGAWVSGFALAVGLTGSALGVRGASWSPTTGHFRIPGSWLPLVLILSLFVLKYVAGILLAMRPSWAGDTSVVIPLGLVYGAFAGLFFGRARSLLALRQNT
jgi:hypothetical protein